MLVGLVGGVAEEASVVAKLDYVASGVLSPDGFVEESLEEGFYGRIPLGEY